MAFKISNYLSEVRDRLKALDITRRVVFSLWCVRPLFDEFSPWLEQKIGAHKFEFLRAALDKAWSDLLTKSANNGSIPRAGSIASSIIWTDEDVSPGEELSNFGAVELVGALGCIFEVIQTGSITNAAKVAEHIINRIDYELLMIDGVEDSFANERMQAEFNRQDLALRYLSQPVPISIADRDRFKHYGAKR